MNKVLILLVFAVLLLSSCGSDDRNKFVGGELTVYYFDESEAKIAKEIAFFWRENGLLTGKQQDLQVQKDKNRFTVSMITSDPKNVKNMPIDEVSVLSQLKKKLYVEVFNRKSFTLEICNNRFETVYTVE
ncbi:MAG: hypothetical protein AB8B56_20430 [Crocinitomicaceae bacterium]